MRCRERWRGSTRFQDVATAAGTFAAGLTFNLVGLTDTWSIAQVAALSGASPWWHTVLLALGCLVMLGKRRRPVLMLGAGVVLGTVDLMLGGSVAVVLVLFDLLFSAGLFASARARTTVATTVFVVIGTASVVGGLALGDLRVAVFIGLQLTTLLFVPLWWASNIRQQQRLGALDAERTAREAVLAERATMARDLHDVIAAQLSTTAIHSGAALARQPDTERDRATLQAVRTSSLAALEEMRSMIMVLRADDRNSTDPTLPGGLDRLPDLVAEASAGGLRVEATTDDVPGVAAVVSHAVYRTVREALTNAAKHAPGSTVRLDVAHIGGRIAVTVTNDLAPGHRVDHASLSSGTGLVSLRERATLLGGDLTAGPDGDHFRVRATLPLHPAAAPIGSAT